MPGPRDSDPKIVYTAVDNTRCLTRGIGSEVTNNGTVPPKPSVPPMPSEVTNAHTRTQRPAAGVFRTAMSPLRKMMRRTPRHA